MNLPNLQGIDWSNKKEVLFRVQGVAADRLRQALEGGNLYVYCQAYADLLAPDVEKAESEVKAAEEKHADLLAKWEAAKARGEEARTGWYNAQTMNMKAEQDRLGEVLVDAQREAGKLRNELLALDEWLKRKRPEVGGLRRTLTALRGVPKPAPDAVAGLRALLGLTDGG